MPDSCTALNVAHETCWGYMIISLHTSAQVGAGSGETDRADTKCQGCKQLKIKGAKNKEPWGSAKGKQVESGEQRRERKFISNQDKFNLAIPKIFGQHKLEPTEIWCGRYSISTTIGNIKGPNTTGIYLDRCPKVPFFYLTGRRLFLNTRFLKATAAPPTVSYIHSVDGVHETRPSEHALFVSVAAKVTLPHVLAARIDETVDVRGPRAQENSFGVRVGCFSFGTPYIRDSACFRIKFRSRGGRFWLTTGYSARNISLALIAIF